MIHCRIFSRCAFASLLLIVAVACSAQTLTIHSPRNYEVFQRSSMERGPLSVSGRVRTACDRVLVRVTGKGLGGELPDKWQGVKLTKLTGAFDQVLIVPAGGWYKVEIKAEKGGKSVAEGTVEKVGVGEVFVGAGQSNSTNSGQFKTQQTSGMVSSFSGSDWRLADDPQPGVHDRSGGGSFWPAFGDALYAMYGVPIGVASTGHGGTSVNQWQPDGELHQWMMVRIHQLGRDGFRAVLWHQGESDVQMPVDEYVTKMTNIIDSSKRLAGWEFPWVVAMVSYHNPEHTSWPNTRAAHKKLWEAGVALEGPDTDTLTGDNRDFEGKGIHFSPKGLSAVGKMFADKVAAVIGKK